MEGGVDTCADKHVSKHTGNVNVVHTHTHTRTAIHTDTP